MTAHVTRGEQDPPVKQLRAAQPPEQALNPLQHLIQQRLRERGWSYREVAGRSGLSHSTIYSLAMTRNLTRPPRPATINGLARGLDVPVSVVRAAAEESTGMNYYNGTPARRHDHDDQERELLITSIDELSPEDRRHVAALVESLRHRASTEQADRMAPPPGPRESPATLDGDVLTQARRGTPLLLIGQPTGTSSCSASSL
jgi:transcriptional regulator with XRE-family HTH domain